MKIFKKTIARLNNTTGKAHGRTIPTDGYLTSSPPPPPPKPKPIKYWV